MIEAKQLTKKFGTTVALNGITFTIGNGSVFGLVGSNGAGKSTFLRTAAGVYKPDEGSLLVDGFSPYSHIPTRERLFFISDFPYFPPQASLSDMFSFYQRLYPGWDRSLCKKLCGLFPLDSRQKIIAMSKGMQRQAALICALSTRPSLLLRQLLADGVAASGMGVVIASHNLRELEDVCDHVGLFHKGGVVLDQDLDELKLNICRVQAVFPSLPEDAFLGLDIIKKDTLGSLITMVIRGDRQKTEEKLRALQPIFLETLPLTLEEVFISEMEAAGYDIDNILS